MDVLAVTDFPDIRVKCAINSAEHGNILIIPREGGYLVRFYIELDDDRARQPSVTPEQLAEVANRILHPYTLEVEGRRLVVGVRDRPAALRPFDDVPARSAGRLRACSSPATPATPTAPRPARA